MRAEFGRVKVVDLELSRPATAIEELGDYVSVCGLVRHHGVPTGWIKIPVARGRCSATEVTRALKEQLPSTIRVGGSADPTWTARGLPSVTVAVCTRDRPDDLTLCLESLSSVDYPELDLVVVDNAPRDEATARLVQHRFPEVRYLRESRPGLDWARNRAIAAARGEIIAFTDDDVVVDAGWIRALAAVFHSDPAVMTVTGIVVPYELETEAQVLFERYRSFDRGFASSRTQIPNAAGRSVAFRYGATGRFGTGANMAFRRELFDRLGLFDPGLGAGTPARGGDDLDMFFRVLKAGYALVYEPRALVRHRHRRTAEELHRQMRDHGISFSAYLARSWLAYPEERGGIARLAAWWAAKTLYRAVRPRGAPKAALRRLALAEMGGLFVGPRCYQKATSAAAVQSLGRAHANMMEGT